MDETKIRIIAADDGDAPEIHALQLAAYHSENALYDTPIPPVTEPLERHLEEFGGWHVLKAVRDGRIVGSVRGRIRDGNCEVARLMVHPSCRGLGLGRRLLEEIERMFPGVPLTLFTGDRSRFNIGFYLRHGYRIIRRDDVAGLVFFRKDTTQGGAYVGTDGTDMQRD